MFDELVSTKRKFFETKKKGVGGGGEKRKGILIQVGLPTNCAISVWSPLVFTIQRNTRYRIIEIHIDKYITYQKTFF